MDKVHTNTNYGQRRLILNDLKIVEFELSAGNYQYFRIYPFDKPTPLIIRLKHDDSLFVVFFSKTNSEPNKLSHDWYSKKSII